MANVSLLDSQVLPVTAVKLIPLSEGTDGCRSILLSASGSCLRAHCLTSSTLLFNQRLLYPSTIHGISFHNPSQKLLCHGQRHCVLATLRRDLHLHPSNLTWSITAITRFPEMADYIHASSFVNDTKMAIATGQGFVEIWEEKAGEAGVVRVASVLSEAHCILYCARFLSIMNRGSAEMCLMGGTVFGELILWMPEKGSGIMSRIQAHGGAVFCMDWAADGSRICSAGDDRKLALWERSVEGGLGFVRKFSVFAHKSRVWSCRIWKENVVSAGEDADVRVWDGQGRCLHVLAGHFGMNVWCCDVLQDEGVLATGGADGDVKLWNLPAIERSSVVLHRLPRDTTVQAFEILRSGVVLCAAESGHLWSVTNTGSNGWEWACVVDSGLEFNSMALCPEDRFAIVGSIQGVCLLIDLHTFQLIRRWKAHNHRLILVALWYTLDRTLQAFTSSVEGSLDRWKLLEGDCPVLQHRYKGNSSDVKPGQIISCCIHKALCGLFGDIRGKLHLCDLREDRLATQESLCLVGVHGKDKISALASHEEFFYSGGHNGTVLEHCVEETATRSLYVRTTRSFKCGPVASIFYIRWTMSGSMILGGFAYEKFYLWNVTDGYLLHQVTCGGWRRPSALSLSEDLNISFIFWPPVKTSKKVACVAQSTVNLTSRVSDANPTSLQLFQRTALCNNSHSRTIWAGVFLTPSVWITACENGVVKVHRKATTSGCIDTIETLYGHGSAVRALHALEMSPGKFLVVSGGGRQILRCWSVHVFKHGELPMTRSECLCEIAPLEDETDHTQRILSVCCSREQEQCGDSSSDNACLVYSGDSNGFVKVYRLTRPQYPGAPQVDETPAVDGSTSVAEENDAAVEGLSKKARKKREWQRVRKQDRQTRYVHTGRHTCRMSENASLKHIVDLKSGPGKPILCLDVLDNLVVAGATDGSLSCWTDKHDQLFCRTVHMMGVNCVSLSRTKLGRFVIVSGGDDQAIGVTLLNDEYQVDKTVLETCACASAIRGIRTDGHVIWAAGLNQRLSVWRIEESLQLSLDHSEAIDCADVNSVDASEDGVMVTGAGFCMFRKRNP